MSALPDGAPELRYKLVPSQRPVLWMISTREAAHEEAARIAAEDAAGVALCEDPGDPYLFRNLYVVKAPKVPKEKK